MSKGKPKKLCIECRHMRILGRDHICKNAIAFYSPINGDAVYEECMRERSYGECGWDAKKFEEARGPF